MAKELRLGVNIDHVATLRNARGGAHPCPVRAALLAQEAGADGITAHLREDRRHIRDVDIARLMQECKLPLNLEMAATDEMVAIALKTKPHAVCIVPEKREERTTEGGLDVIGGKKLLSAYILRLVDAGIRVSLFINPAIDQVEASREVGAQVVELHTGKYCEEFQDSLSTRGGVLYDDLAGESARSADGGGVPPIQELKNIQLAAAHAAKIGLECHAGHGLAFDTVAPIAAIADIVELNIGHFLIGEAIFSGLSHSIKRMKQLMKEART